MRLFEAGRVFETDDHQPVAAGRLFFYSNGTTTLKAVYTDAAKTIQAANPLTLNSNGRLPYDVFGDGLYSVRLNDVNGDVVWSEDDVGRGITAESFLPDYTGAVARTVEDKLEDYISVKDFGALGDGVTDDAVAIQACFDYVIANGGEAYFPAGEYVCGTRLDFVESSADHDEYTKGSIRGAGPGSSVIRFTGTETTTAGIRFAAPAASQFQTFFSVKDIRIMNNIGTRVGTAFQIDNLAFVYFEFVYITGWDLAIDATDLLSTNFVGCYIRLNKRGGYFRRGNISRPNALTFTGCNIANSQYGLWVEQPTTFSMTGGAVEGNGFTGTEPTTSKWGIKLTDGGRGPASANFESVYFEKTVGQADVWIDQNGATNTEGATYNFTSCAFHRIEAGEFCINNIYVENDAGPAYLNLKGCGFRGFNDYVASAARQYVNFVESGGDIIFRHDGCLFTDPIEDPTVETITGPGSILPQRSTTYIVTTGTDAYALSDGVVEERIFILCTGYVGDGTLTPTSLGGGTTITFTAAGQFAVLEWRQNDWWMTAGTATLA